MLRQSIYKENYQGRFCSRIRHKNYGGEFVSAIQIAQAVLFLCGLATSEMRGANLVIDGGWSAQ
ncbi:MAG: hypothetical protein LBQ08_04015 [Holosporaceae bacterium]|nr:hypothetical protein [Holosporaceae bacterium]